MQRQGRSYAKQLYFRGLERMKPKEPGGWMRSRGFNKSFLNISYMPNNGQFTGHEGRMKCSPPPQKAHCLMGQYVTSSGAGGPRLELWLPGGVVLLLELRVTG